MNKKINLLISALVALSLSGCGGSSDNSTVSADNSNVGSNIRMERNVQYVVKKGDEIEKISENPKLKINSNLLTGKSVVTLLSGSAAIIRGAK